MFFFGVRSALLARSPARPLCGLWPVAALVLLASSIFYQTAATCVVLLSDVIIICVYDGRPGWSLKFSAIKEEKGSGRVASRVAVKHLIVSAD